MKNNILEISPSVYYVGVNDRTKHLFEGLWPLPQGVSYNSYLVVDEKIALVDTVDACYTDLFIASIQQQIGDRAIDYLVINHMEPDHSASIRAIRLVYPNITIVGNNKTLGMVEGFYGVAENTLQVADGDTLSLGSKTLSFALTPMLHWPETMVTYCAENKLLFSGDAFGCYGALSGAVVDEDMDTTPYWDEMVRYYANIVGKYGASVQKALAKLAPLDIEIICSTHGPVWKKEIAKVIETYDKLSRFEAEEGVVIAYGSMYGNTEQMAEMIARELAVCGVQKIVMHNVSVSHPSYILRDMYKYKALIVGSPTYNTQLFPAVEALVAKMEGRDMKNRYFAYFGSFTWAGAAVKRLAAFAEKSKFEVVGEPVEMKQAPTTNTVEACKALAQAVAAALAAK